MDKMVAMVIRGKIIPKFNFGILAYFISMRKIEASQADEVRYVPLFL